MTPAATKLVLPGNWLEMVTPWERATKAQSELMTSEAIAHPAALDEIHRSIGDTLHRHGYAWVTEDHKGRTIVQLHLAGLRVDHEENKRLGIYDTNSPGTDRSKPDAYAFLKPNGGLALRRFGDAADVVPWYQGPSGIWCCEYNIPPSFRVACTTVGGIKNEKVYSFYEGRAAKALTLLGIDAKIPEPLQKCRTDLSLNGENLVIAIHSKSIGDFEGWTFDYGKYLKQVEHVSAKVELPTFEARLSPYNRP